MFIFNREKCIADIIRLGFKPNECDLWVDACIGRVLDEKSGTIGKYGILPDWCDEVNIKFNLTPAEVEYMLQDNCTVDDINNSTAENIIEFLTPMYGRGTPECAEMTRRIEQCLH